MLRIVVGCLGVTIDEVLKLQLIRLRRRWEALPDLLDDRLLLLRRSLLERLPDYASYLEDLDAFLLQHLR